MCPIRIGAFPKGKNNLKLAFSQLKIPIFPPEKVLDRDFLALYYHLIIQKHSGQP
jgi:hypothetical protein